MRPTRIQLEGFMAYREQTEIDFDGVDFFSLSGPTGSGKSSLIDAMVFALYGRVPRLDAKSVAPVLSSGAERARISLDFEVNGQSYTAARSVKRTNNGATTDEARLQQGDDVLASGASAVTAAAGDLLSLGFEDFTRTVVLPQGEFAEFLEATPGERQRLLRKLLEYDFSKVRNLAQTRSAVAAARASEAFAKVSGLDFADHTQMKTLTTRLADLDKLAEAVVAKEKELRDLEALANLHQADVVRLQSAVERISEVEPPGNLEDLAAAVSRATSEVETAAKAHESAAVELKAARDSLETMPSSEKLDSYRSLHERVAKTDQAVTDLGEGQVQKANSEADTLLAVAETEYKAVQSELEELRSAHAAHSLGQHLSEGDTCPVCAQTIVDLNDREDPEGFEQLESTQSRVAAQVEKARLAHTTSGQALIALMAKKEQLSAELIRLNEELADKPGPDEISEMATQLEAAELLVGKRTSALEGATKMHKTASMTLEDSAEAVASLGRSLMACREKIADLEPPLPSADDPLVQWKELLSWAVDAKAALVAGLEDASKLSVESAKTAQESNESLRAELTHLSIDPEEPYAVVVTKTVERVRAEVEANQARAKEAKELKKLAKASSAEADLANGLANHLKSNGFEQWLMQGALADLVDGANQLLVDLSGNGYSLSDEDDGTFQIVDHRNAGEKRPVATLSGGETFLVSLALALSLAETLAGTRGAGLDAIFLDEGFGSLDEESLEVVASVLEELTGSGLMVGVISHVSDLAARAPVRFEVTRTASGSNVKLVTS
jgi:exonuclease SbcC